MCERSSAISNNHCCSQGCFISTCIQIKSNELLYWARNQRKLVVTVSAKWLVYPVAMDRFIERNQWHPFTWPERTSTDKIASGLVHSGAGRKGRAKEAQKEKSCVACLLKRHVLTTDGIQTQNWNGYIEGIWTNRVIYVKRPPLKQWNIIGSIALSFWQSNEWEWLDVAVCAIIIWTIWQEALMVWSI